MSDRFVRQATKEEIETLFGVSSEREDFFKPEYNITPGSLITTIYQENEERNIYKFIWGMIPPNAESERDGRDNYAIAQEKIWEDDWYKECLQQRRCLIPANGFYKWKSTERKSTPFYIRLLSNEVTAFAGIYSIWESKSGRKVYSCAILTTSANALIQPVDDRMPVLLHPDYFDKWLSDDSIDKEELDSMLRPYSMTDMAVNRVSEEVNNPENNSPELIQPIPK
jgi:putative SOS response-associated peptidase YedK